MAKLIDQVEIANPQEPHCPVVLLLDVSTSMAGPKLQQLNDGLKIFKDEICGVDGEGGDALARKRVDLCVIAFSSSALKLQDFSSMDQFHPMPLTASGGTAMGAALQMAVDEVENRKREYKAMGVDYYRPWILLMTDGEPTDMEPGDSLWTKIAAIIRDGETNKKFVLFSVGVDQADLSLLSQLAPPNRPPVLLRPGMFNNMFKWLSSSLIKVSGSRVGQTTQLDNPKTGDDAWAV